MNENLLWRESVHVKLIIFDWVFTPKLVLGTEFSFVTVGHGRGEVVFCVLVSILLTVQFKGV